MFFFFLRSTIKGHSMKAAAKKLYLKLTISENQVNTLYTGNP